MTPKNDGEFRWWPSDNFEFVVELRVVILHLKQFCSLSICNDPNFHTKSLPATDLSSCRAFFLIVIVNSIHTLSAE